MRTRTTRRSHKRWAAGLAATAWLVWSTPGPTFADSEQDRHPAQLYSCGMHPDVLQKDPGRCPICGMDLTPVRRPSARNTDPSVVRIDPVVVQNMGLRIQPVTRGPLSRTVRTIGEVVVAEDLLSVVGLKFAGWIEKLYVEETGVKVRKGQALFRVYSPELVAAQEEYLLALRAGGPNSPLARAARTKLSLYDLPPATVAALEKRGKPLRTITIRAPRSGFVLQKSIVEGERARPGDNLFRIGKLGKIWVQVQVYEFDAPWIAIGQTATMELAFQRGKLYQGKVSYIYPTLNTRTRTLTVRLEFVNPALKLKPGMFATVRIQTRRKEAVIRVPTAAIIHSGQRQLVFVALGLGRYAPREVVTGLVGRDDLTEVVTGLSPGQSVVVSGQFLLDSESQLREAVMKMQATHLHRHPATGGTTPTRAARSSEQPQHGSVPPASASQPAADTPWSCPMHPKIREPVPGRCPVCRMDLQLRPAP